MSRTAAYARLIRLPNVFTACADVSIGLLAGGASVLQFAAIGLASACCYSAGMALNDYFDRKIDAVERPSRPIPSGTIPAKHALSFAVGLAAVALAISCAAGLTAAIHVSILLALILAYDGWLKSTPVGPPAMGGCRFANVLLGFAVTDVDWQLRCAAAAAVGVYVVGITLFARDEAGTSRRTRLSAAFAVCLAGIILALVIPSASSSLHPYVVAGLLIALIMAGRPALLTPDPRPVQRFVKTAILGIIVLDAALAMALAGPAGLLVLIWLIPAVALGRRLYST